jgi:microcystin-dependent protein
MSKPDVSGITNNFFTTVQKGFSDSLNGSITNSSTTIAINSLAGYANNDWVFLWVEPGTANAELVFGEVFGNSLINCVRGILGSAAAHTSGATVASYVSSANWMLLIKMLEQEHNSDGTHGDITADTLSVGGVDFTNILPTGVILPYGGTSAPSGYLLCDGSAVSRSTYSNLFSTISTTYGSGNGSTTFNVPDMRGRVAVGKNTGTFTPLGHTGGEETHTLSIGELASHNHTGTTGSGGSHSHTYSAWRQSTYPGGGIIGGGSLYGNPPISTGNTSTDGSHTHSFTSDTTGSGTAHNNLQPYLVTNHIIKT